MRLSVWTYRQAMPAPVIRTAALLASIFVMLAVITLLLCHDAVGNSSFWPANAALVVAFILLPWRLSWLTACVCLVANLVLNRLFSDITSADNATCSLLNVMLSFTAAFLTRLFCGATTDLSRFRRLAVFGAICFLSAGTEAAVGKLISPGNPANVTPLQDWMQWTLCDGCGLLLATPAILLAIKSQRARYSCDATLIERWLLLLGTVALTLGAFTCARSSLFLLIYPALILTAFRAGAPWVLACVLLAAIISSAMTVHGLGPLAFLSSSGRMLRQDVMQPYLISLFLAAVPANNVLGERSRAARRLERLKATLEYSATRDALTGLVNRSLFKRRLRALLQTSDACAVFFIDLDRFKHVNDTLGHQAGDELLCAFSDRLLGIIGAGATVARFGGDEFAVLVEGSRHADNSVFGAETLCRSMVAAARAPFILTSGSAHVSASIGVAFATGDAIEVDELMRKADIALYTAKSGGRDRYCVFNRKLDLAARDRAELEADLRSALGRSDELTLHYQVKVGRDGSPWGVEALLRWQHPLHGSIAPDRFIPIAEETGLIIPLGAWVFRQAVAFAERWPELTVAVNVSPVQLRHPQFVAETLEALRASPRSAGRMELEVTETALMDAQPATGSLAALREAGLHIALDDFGTGYSSLRHLHRFGVDRVKIDRSFVNSLGSSLESAAIVQAVIQLGHAMGLQVTAEGVETEAQRDFLVAAGIDELQGYLFARPVAEASLAGVMRLPASMAAA